MPQILGMATGQDGGRNCHSDPVPDSKPYLHPILSHSPGDWGSPPPPHLQHIFSFLFFFFLFKESRKQCCLPLKVKALHHDPSSKRFKEKKKFPENAI
uniref:Uncharacterized protein n=1 Tax=Rhizophora mucronata TaxID=61149 RepID=A0A2P2L9H2_RHIMU